MSGILNLDIEATPISILDFETTGMIPGRDRVIEATVVRREPGQQPQLVFDTLINPGGRVKATEIHGITDEDVAEAPTFEQVAGNLLNALEGSVVAAFNVYFDIKFLKAELERVGVSELPPHFCLMYMRPMLGIGPKMKLAAVCDDLGVVISHAHVASGDALATAEVLEHYLGELRERQIATYADLTRMKRYKFMESFEAEPLGGAKHFQLPVFDRLFSRVNGVKKQPLDPMQQALRSYWDTIAMIIADLEATDEEVEAARRERKQLGLSKEQIRFLHARAFASAILQFIDDQELDDKEAKKLRRLHKALAKMGWAPGQ